MPGDRLRHDVAWGAAQAICEMITCPRPEELNELRGFVHRAVMAALAAYDIHREREAARLKPSCN